MIRRVVLIALRPQHRDPDSRALVVRTALETLARCPMVEAIEGGPCADERTGREWDVGLIVTFADMDAARAYRDDATHRAFADVFLAPLARRVHVLHFELGSPEPS